MSQDLLEDQAAAIMSLTSAPLVWNACVTSTLTWHVMLSMVPFLHAALKRIPAKLLTPCDLIHDCTLLLGSISCTRPIRHQVTLAMAPLEKSPHVR